MASGPCSARPKCLTCTTSQQGLEERYEYHEAPTQFGGKIKLFKTIQAKDLWRKMPPCCLETGHPWLTFKDPATCVPAAARASRPASEPVRTEITLNNQQGGSLCATSLDQPAEPSKTASFRHRQAGKIHQHRCSMLDNVIDINYYSVPQA
jgi:ribonucleoside-diphosphate reductase alpha chain